MPVCKPLHLSLEATRGLLADWGALWPGPLHTADETTKATKPPHRPIIAGDIGWGVQSAAPTSSAQVRRRHSGLSHTELTFCSRALLVSQTRHFRRDGMAMKTTVSSQTLQRFFCARQASKQLLCVDALDTTR